MTDNKSLSYLMDIDKVNKEKFSQIISDIENLKTEVSNIKSKVDSSLPVDISSVNTSISDVKNDISGVSTKVDGISTDISGLSGNYYERNLVLPKEDILNFKHTSSTYSNSTSEKTMLSVSGKGMLVYAYASLYSPWDHTLYCDIIIDGKHFKIQNHKSGETKLFLCNKTLISKPTYTISGNSSFDFFDIF